ncbi:hypothetical protein [Sphingobium yanoikuyae]
MAPKIEIVLRILAAITGIATDDPALLCCCINVVAPFAMQIVTREAPLPVRRTIEQMPRDELSRHFRRFVHAGLQAIACDHAGKSARVR